MTIFKAGALVLVMSLVAAGAPLQVPDLTSLVQIGGPPWTQSDISPDGKFVAYVTADPSIASLGTTFDPRGPGRKALWVVASDGGARREIGDASLNNWAPAWSPDSKTLAFYSGKGKTASLELWNAESGAIRRMDVVVPSDWGPYPVLWLNDSKRLILPTIPNVPIAQVSPKARPVATPTPSVTVFMSTPPPIEGNAESPHVITRGLYQDANRFDLTLLDTSGTAKQILSHGVYPAAMRLTPSKRYLAYLVDKGEVNNDVNSRELFDVVVVDLQTLSSKVVANDILTNFGGNTLTWSPDEHQLAYVGGRYPQDEDPPAGDYGTAFPGHLYLLDAQAVSDPRKVSGQLLARNRGTLWWSPDGSSIAAADYEAHVLWLIQVPHGEARPALDLGDSAFTMANRESTLTTNGAVTMAFAAAPNGEELVYAVDTMHWRLSLLARRSQSITALRLAADGKSAVYTGEDISHPADLWVTRDDFASVQRLTNVNPSIGKRALGTVEDVNWENSDGAPRRGVLILPADYQHGQKYPMITWIYGGEREGTLNRNRFGINGNLSSAYMNLQLFASRGYAVFVPDTVLHIGSPMHDLAKDVLPGVDHLVASGIADRDRLGLYGQSYGGYSTLALVAQTNVFKTAVAMSGIDDLFAMFGTMSENGSDWTSFTESEQGRMGGSPWEYPQRYIDNSPFFSLDRVHTPLLLEYGATDKFAAINFEQTFVSLRSLGRTAELVRYSDEGHVLESPSNQIDMANRVLQWFDSYLHPR